jgi:predicted DsbA family dithiol-disulfide isomerase
MITVYFDFLCPFAWRGVELLAALEIPFRPVHFSLVQSNHPENAGLLRSEPRWKLAEQPFNGTPAHEQSLEAFLSSHAAAHQGSAAHERFILELFRLKHLEKKDLNTPTALEAAEKANLNLEAFRDARADETARRAELTADLERASALSVFGTPTIQLETGEAAYYRFATLPETQEGKSEAWGLFKAVLRSGSSIETIKRPRAGSKA